MQIDLNSPDTVITDDLLYYQLAFGSEDFIELSNRISAEE